MKILTFRVNEYICELLYQGTKHAIAAHFLGISALLFIFKERISFQVFLMLVLIFSVVIIGRGISLWLYFKRVKSTQNIKFWYIVYLFGLLISSLTWTMMIALLFPEQPPGYQLLIITVAMGFVAGAIITISVDKLMVLVFTQPIVLMIIIQFYTFNSTDNTIYQLSAGLLIFLNIPIITSALTSSEESFRLYQSSLLDRQMNAAKTDFLAKMSHELRTPMNAVIGIGYLLEKANLSEEEQAYVAKLQQASTSLLGVINSILDFSRIEAGQMVLEAIPFDLRDVLNTVKTQVEIQAKQKSLNFIIKIDKNVTDHLIGDPLRLTQILTNLAANGIKFTQQGSVTINVCQRSKDQHAVQLDFQVIDTGIGIRERDQKKLFVSFSQVNSSDSRKYGGSGLGLVISQNLLALMHSKIQLNSVFGAGSSFSFSIKLELAPEGSIDADPAQHQLSACLTIMPELQYKQVLLVDDDPLNRIIAKEILQKFGLQVSVAEGAKAAFLQLENQLVDLIFMDIQMPEITGYEALKVIRETAAWTNIPVIALTANASSLEKKKALAYGMNDFLTKPIDPRQLRDSLLQWIPHDKPQTILVDQELSDNTVNLLEMIEMRLDSALEVEEKLNSVVIMLGSEFSTKLFTSLETVITQEKPLLIEHLQQQKINKARHIAHKLKGSLSLYGSTRLNQLLIDIEEKTISPHEMDDLCSALETEFNFIQAALKVYL